MGPAKAQLIQLIQDQPGDSSPRVILRELACAVMAEGGIADSDAGRTLSNEEMGRRVGSLSDRVLLRPNDEVHIVGVFHGAMRFEEYLK